MCCSCGCSCSPCLGSSLISASLSFLHCLIASSIAGASMWVVAHAISSGKHFMADAEWIITGVDDAPFVWACPVGAPIFKGIPLLLDGHPEWAFTRPVWRLTTFAHAVLSVFPSLLLGCASGYAVRFGKWAEQLIAGRRLPGSPVRCDRHR